MLAEFGRLWQKVDTIWDQHDADPAFAGYVSADYEVIFHELKKLKSLGVKTFLEWGSGLGVVAIMASRIGFDAFGIEAESKLVDISCDLIEDFGSNAKIALGSFIPDAFVWEPAKDDETQRTSIDAPDAYESIELELSDFDVVYAYPWPTEQLLYRQILGEFGGPNVKLLTYDARCGAELVSLNQESKSREQL